MPMQSVYEFTCVCGRNFQTEDPHEIECPVCGRALTVEWRRPPHLREAVEAAEATP